MFQVKQPRTMLGSLGSMLELIFHSTVREIRKSHRNAIVGLLMNMVQALVFVGAFYAMFQLLGMRRSQIRGDFLL